MTLIARVTGFRMMIGLRDSEVPRTFHLRVLERGFIATQAMYDSLF